MQVETELRDRGVRDIFIACVHGLKDFPDAVKAVFPKAVVQLCIVHMCCATARTTSTGNAGRM
ncbi:hypothetical protein AcdelDRAFT_0382 [Acidovorax delafieldii 2AN]|uniref:Mutator family transposase n=1 Tax=Acidovorax delafieldii 2AN TaxID=573060 RepID=C5T0F2_ACIDE|nr:hypothetical protein AcdelDRAFT_0382 [Acidovorax delafieldii 2AN]